MKKYQKGTISNKSRNIKESLSSLPKELRSLARQKGRKLKVKLRKTISKFGMKTLSAKLPFPKDLSLASPKMKLSSINKIMKPSLMTRKI
jgi:hypothetical protein